MSARAARDWQRHRSHPAAASGTADGQPAAPIDITLDPARIRAMWFASIAVLLVAHAAGQIARFRFGHDYLIGLVPLFYFDREGNVPTWWSAAALLCCAMALATVARLTRAHHRPHAFHWRSLAVVFAYVSLDEAAQIHERIGPLMRGPLQWLSDSQGGVFTHLARLPSFAWTLPAIAMMMAVSPWYLRFFRSLPRPTDPLRRRRLLLHRRRHRRGAGGRAVQLNRRRPRSGLCRAPAHRRAARCISA